MFISLHLKVIKSLFRKKENKVVFQQMLFGLICLLSNIYILQLLAFYIQLINKFLSKQSLLIFDIFMILIAVFFYILILLFVRQSLKYIGRSFYTLRFRYFYQLWEYNRKIENSSEITVLTTRQILHPKSLEYWKKRVCPQCYYYSEKDLCLCAVHPNLKSNCPDFKPNSDIIDNDKYTTNDWDKPLEMAHNDDSYFEIERTVFGEPTNIDKRYHFFLFTDELYNFAPDWAAICLDTVEKHGYTKGTAAYYQAYLRQYLQSNTIELRYITTCFHWQKWYKKIQVYKLGFNIYD